MQKQKSKKLQDNHSFRHHRLLKIVGSILGGAVVLLGGLYIAFQVSPWPGALLIRYEFQKGGAAITEALQKHIPSGVAAMENQQYRPNDTDGFLDVFYPEKTTTALPTIVWVHGGAWVSGDKNDVDGYLKILASHGYTTVGVDYTVAPEKQYPMPLVQLNDALAYLEQHAERLHIDPNNIVLAGDSAGSQIVAQMAAMITSSAYAQEVAIKPTLAAHKLKGTLLNCGAYDIRLPDYNSSWGWFLHTVLWAYSGKKDFLSDPRIQQASVVNYVTKDFPPSFITAGNADPLEEQSKEFATKLNALGVETSALFYPANHQPLLSHEYQFNLDTNDGQQALTAMLEFLKKQFAK